MELYGLLGNPVGHSLSPPMHDAAYETLGRDAAYVTFEPDANPEALETAVSGAEALGIDGLNVTIPFKQDVLDLGLVEPDDLAARIGAVNTIDFATDPPRGYNTDADGLKRAFAHHDVSIDGRNAVLVGAGGAGRAAAFALADAGATVAIANRTESKAHDLADAVPAASGHGLEELPDLIEEATLLVNATSVGMEEDRSPVPAGALHAELTVLDAVYQPLRTRLVEDAAEAGAETIDGAWMLLYQGVEAFERWTGASAPVAAMNEALRERL